MNTFNKIMLGALILGTGAQTINAHPWTTKAIAAVTLAGLGIGTVKYYGFNTVTNAVLEKCANAKNWFSNKVSDAVFGSYKKQIQSLRKAQTKHLKEVAEEQAILKEEIHTVLAEKDAQLISKEADRKDAHIRAINLTNSIMAKDRALKALKEEKERVEQVQRGTIAGIYNRSGVLESEQKEARAHIAKLEEVIANQEQAIADLTQTLTQLQTKLVTPQPTPAHSDEATSESSVATTDADAEEFNITNS